MTLNILPIVKKEFRQIARDKRALLILILFPALMLLLVGYALNFDVKHLKLAVYDEDWTAQSRELVASTTQSEYFDYALTLESKDMIDRVLEGGDAHLVLVIPTDFSRKLESGGEAVVPVKLLEDRHVEACDVVTGDHLGPLEVPRQALELPGTVLRRLPGPQVVDHAAVDHQTLRADQVKPVGLEVEQLPAGEVQDHLRSSRSVPAATLRTSSRHPSARRCSRIQPRAISLSLT